MADTMATVERAALRRRDLALAVCLAWLLVQNSILVLWFSQSYLGVAFTVIRALLKVGAHLVGELWMLPVAVLLGVALALSTSGREDAPRTNREVSHAGL